MDIRTSSDYRLVQVFVSNNGVFETYVNVRKNNFACTCPGFRARSRCKHSDYVIKRAEESGYALDLLNNHEPITEAIRNDPERFREWVIRNTKVVSL